MLLTVLIVLTFVSHYTVIVVDLIHTFHNLLEGARDIYRSPERVIAVANVIHA